MEQLTTAGSESRRAALLAFHASFAGTSDGELAGMLTNEVQAIPALRLDRAENVSDTDATFVLFTRQTRNGFATPGDKAVVKFRKIGDEWKCAGVL